MTCGPKYSNTNVGYCKVVGPSTLYLGWGYYTKKLSNTPEFKALSTDYFDQMANSLKTLAKDAAADTFFDIKNASKTTVYIYTIWLLSAPPASSDLAKHPSYPDAIRIDVAFDVKARNAYFTQLYDNMVRTKTGDRKTFEQSAYIGLKTLKAVANVVHPFTSKSYISKKVSAAAATEFESAVAPKIDEAVKDAKKDVFLWGSLLAASVGVLAWQIVRR